MAKMRFSLGVTKIALLLLINMELRRSLFHRLAQEYFRFPLERASKIALIEINAFLEGNISLEEVVIVCFNDISYQLLPEILR